MENLMTLLKFVSQDSSHFFGTLIVLAILLNMLRAIFGRRYNTGLHARVTLLERQVRELRND